MFFKNLKLSLVHSPAFQFKRGFTLTEAVVTLGVVITLSSIAVVSYYRYYKRGQLTKIRETAENFFTAVDVCLLKYEDDPKKCTKLTNLKFSCSYCSSTVWFRPNNSSATDPFGDSFRIEITVKEYRADPVFRTDEIIPGIYGIQKTGTTQKFCSLPVPNRTTEKTIKRPPRECASASDCSSGEECHQYPMANWGGGGAWEVIP